MTITMGAMILAAAASAAPVTEVPLARALLAAQAAFETCKGTPVAVALIDSEAMPRLVLVGDGASSRMATFAVRKATTALQFGKPTAQVRDEARTNPELASRIARDPALIAMGGGLPFAGGAVGVGGAPSQLTDMRCAAAAVAILEAQP